MEVFFYNQTTFHKYESDNLQKIYSSYGKRFQVIPVGKKCTGGGGMLCQIICHLNLSMSKKNMNINICL